ncbi:MAG: NtaA/DmoA family FMN-dependent monooxygenase [Acidimicrobiia bacterium]
MKKLHLLWFLAGIQPRGWLDPRWGTGYDFRRKDVYLDGARTLERACFDGIFVADQPTIDTSYSGTIEPLIRSGYESISADPMPIMAMIGAHTEHIGVVGTYSSTYTPPFLLARMMNALDHLTDGRAGWNVVTSARLSDGDNFGVPLPPPEQRYDMADEYVALCKQLWRSWDPDAVLLDREAEEFADPAKVRHIDFEGKWYRSRGPLPMPASPQVVPVIFQAGASDRGRIFGAANAEVIMGNQNSTVGMKSFVDDVTAIAARLGRPDRPKFVFNVQPVIGETEEIAQARFAVLKERAKTRPYLDGGLGFASQATGTDFGRLDLDVPLADQLDRLGVTRNPQSLIFQYVNEDPAVTPRDIGEREALKMTLPVVGTAESVADRLCEVAEETGADGFQFRESLHPSYLADICDGLVPALQRRGAARTEYSGKTFRENLNEF